MNSCELCRRASATTAHHLVPRARRKREAGFGPTADLCPDCHRMIHATFDNARLGRELNTVASLQAAPELARYLAWIKKRPATQSFAARRRKA